MFISTLFFTTFNHCNIKYIDHQSLVISRHLIITVSFFSSSAVATFGSGIALQLFRGEYGISHMTSSFLSHIQELYSLVEDNVRFKPIEGLSGETLPTDTSLSPPTSPTSSFVYQVCVHMCSVNFTLLKLPPPPPLHTYNARGCACIQDIVQVCACA